jgi:hypothetical protein
MPHFLEIYAQRYGIFLPRAQTQEQPDRFTNQISEKFWEKLWDDSEFKAKMEKEKRPLQLRAKQARENRENLTPENLPLMILMNLSNSVYKKDHIEAVHRLMDLCRNQNIFVVVCVTPQWYGQLNFTQQDIEKPTDDVYLSLLKGLNERPDCAVIICRDFEEITNEGTDEDYLFDFGHMTRKGAILYTNWLIDRLQEIPKTAEVMRLLRR